MKAALPAIFTIERESEPASTRRYLGIGDDGLAYWLEPSAPFSTFITEGAARAYRRFRMGPYAYEAKVVRHTVQ